jgi:hypothetical protein
MRNKYRIVVKNPYGKGPYIIYIMKTYEQGI